MKLYVLFSSVFYYYILPTQYFIYRHRVYYKIILFAYEFTQFYIFLNHGYRLENKSYSRPAKTAFLKVKHITQILLMHNLCKRNILHYINFAYTVYEYLYLHLFSQQCEKTTCNIHSQLVNKLYNPHILFK